MLSIMQKYLPPRHRSNTRPERQQEHGTLIEKEKILHRRRVQEGKDGDEVWMWTLQVIGR
jgi:hypothetical protein